MTGVIADVLRPIVLRDGTEVQLHAMCPQDAAALVQFHLGLSTETTYFRFFSVHPELSTREIDRFTHVDHQDREALVATVEDRIIAVARFDRAGDRQEAEAAFVVADVWQGEGLGSELLHRLVSRAREVGITCLAAEVLPQNRRMLAVLRHAGYPVATVLRDGVVHVELDLGAMDRGREDALGS